MVRHEDEAFPRCAGGTTIRAACTGLVDDLHERWGLPSVYLLIDGRLRCQASRGYFHVSDGFTPATGIIGRVIKGKASVLIEDVTTDPSFIAAIPGLRSEVCVPVWVGDEVVGAVNLESRTTLGAAAVGELERAAACLGQRLEALGGLAAASLAERLARIAVSLAGQTDARQVQVLAVEGALAISGMGSAALAYRNSQGVWSVRHAAGPLEQVLHGWDVTVLQILGDWVWAGTSSYFPDGEAVPPGYEFLEQGGIRALSVQPLVVAGQVTGMLLTADTETAVHDPALTTAMELLASQTAATLAMIRTLAHLERLANHDPLTGLVNRRRLLETLQTAVDQQHDKDWPGAALVLLDLDGFKAVNDHHGHAVGDTVLCAVARRLEACARQGDVVCRLGGDEFAVLVKGIASPDEAAAIGNRYVAAVSRPPTGPWHPPVGASAGVRVVAGPSASAILVDADVALYAAKQAGRGHRVLWDVALRADELEQDLLVADLRQALATDALTLVYQPVVDIRTLRVRGAEALARWHHPQRGDVAPSEFVALAERAGLAGDLTRWVLQAAFRDASSWAPAPDGEDINVAVNISAAQLGDNLVVSDVRRALNRANLPGSRVVLEVTETAEVVDLESAKRTLDALADLGLALALDDFGTGFSSLTHVQALPFDILKIDRSFVAAAAIGDGRAIATIAAICALATRIDVDVVAEGLESKAQLAELTDLGCTYVQGFALAPPLLPTQVAAALARQDEGGWVLGPQDSLRIEVPAARRYQAPRRAIG
ncbi:MAG: hypothetical protein JWM02_2701 [Frankiales bacterium]|nr:hypothetical protein [Frankiales bacterium]